MAVEYDGSSKILSGIASAVTHRHARGADSAAGKRVTKLHRQEQSPLREEERRCHHRSQEC